MKTHIAIGLLLSIALIFVPSSSGSVIEGYMKVGTSDHYVVIANSDWTQEDLEGALIVDGTLSHIDASCWSPADWDYDEVPVEEGWYVEVAGNCGVGPNGAPSEYCVQSSVGGDTGCHVVTSHSDACFVSLHAFRGTVEATDVSDGFALFEVDGLALADDGTCHD